MNEKFPVISLFISDVHLGLKEAGGADLLSMLEIVQPKNIFLVGDVIDIRVVRRNNFLRLADFLLAMRILKAMTPSKVIYLPGNHDPEITALSDFLPAGLKVSSEYAYSTKAGHRILIFHGHQVDTHVGTRNELLFDVICTAYAAALRIQDFVRRSFHKNVSLRNLNVVAHARFMFPSWRRHVSTFERRVRLYAEQQGFRSAICGHIHVPKIAQTDDFTYYNTGDWVENRTALIETLEGEFELVVFDPASKCISIAVNGTSQTDFQ